MTSPGLSADERFDMKVNWASDGCQEWQAGKYKSGYGAFSMSPGRNIVAHKYSWQRHHGPVPKGLLVLHRCDNTSCVNVDHLFLGTHKDNTHDMMKKGRAGWQNGRMKKSGEYNGRAKLTEWKINGILLLLAQGVRQVDAGAHYGVGQSTVSRIVRGVGWTHLAA